MSVAGFDRAISRGSEIPLGLGARLGVSSTRSTVDPHVDGLRGVAVLTVFTLHWWLIAGEPRISAFGVDLRFIPFSFDWGVDLFFILSGFLLARPWFRAEFGIAPRPRLSHYWRRRLGRILPAYYLSIILTLAIFSTLGPIRQAAIEGPVGLWNLGGQLLMAQRYLPISAGALNGANGVWWTLSVEATWYLLLPVAVWAFTGRRWMVALPAAAILTIAWDFAAKRSFSPLVEAMADSIGWPIAWEVGVSDASVRDLLIYGLPAYLLTFAVGVSLARLAVLREEVDPHRRASKRNDRTPGWVALIAGVALLCLTIHHDGMARLEAGTYFLDTPRSNVARALALGLILLGLILGPRTLRRPLEFAPLRYVGWVSYGIYLLHVPTLVLLHKQAGVNSPTMLYLVALAVVITVATLSWVAVERPFLAASASGRQRLVVAVALATAAAASYVWAIHQQDPPTRWTAIIREHQTDSERPVVPALHPMTDVTPLPDRSGPKTLTQAVREGLLTANDSVALGKCGVTRPGSVVVAGTAMWVAVVASFDCRNPAKARRAADSLTRLELADGYIPQAGKSFTDLLLSRRGPYPAFPVVHHLRWASGRDVTEATVSSKDWRQVDETAVDAITRSAAHRPPG